MLFLWAVAHTKLFQVAVQVRQRFFSLEGKKKCWMGDSRTDIWRGGVGAKKTEERDPKCTIRIRKRELEKKGGEKQKRSRGDDEKEGARLSWSAARRLCGPCVPAWRKQARQRKGKRTPPHTPTRTHACTQLRRTHRNTQQFPKLGYLLNTKTHYTHTCMILCDAKRACTRTRWLPQSSVLIQNRREQIYPGCFRCSRGPNNSAATFLIFVPLF